MSPQISQCAGMRRDDICIYVSPSNRARLTALIDDRNTPSKVVWRAEIVLATADGHGTNEIIRRTGKSKPCVWRWQERYVEEGVLGLMRDKTRPSRKPPLPDKVKLAVLTKTANETPANATHWSRATMAAEMGISPSSVGRIWAEAGLKPHLVHRFKISNDPQFEEKVTDVVGLYMNPPDRALVLCVDEKSQIQALDRTQPGLPLKKGRAATMTHDYKRHGTTTLFAALDVKSGIVIGECQPRHRAKEFMLKNSSDSHVCGRAAMLCACSSRWRRLTRRAIKVPSNFIGRSHKRVASRVSSLAPSRTSVGACACRRGRGVFALPPASGDA